MSRARLTGTGLPAGAVSTTGSRPIESWALASTEPGEWASPDDLDPDAAWRTAPVPGTVAQAVGPDGLDGHDDYDASDWWYRASFPCEDPTNTSNRLRFDGLATLAEVWLNGEPILESSNMFCSYEVDVSDLLSGQNELVIAFRSIRAHLNERRPRPRWKTRLVDDQQLRWLRTTLLGRIPGWTPSISPVGPWRDVRLERIDVARVDELRFRTEVEGDSGIVHLALRMSPVGASVRPESARLRVGDEERALDVEEDAGAWVVRARCEIPDVARWWPATHGRPVLYDSAVEVETSAGPVVVDTGPVGFREIRLDTDDGTLQLVVNGVPVFCRGACWTTDDVVSLVGSGEHMRSVLRAAVEANANMVRVGGTMVYETEEFYRACDELGLLVWQDFMFANMDYPVDDADFASSIRDEAEQQLRRLTKHPSVAAFCGGSEVEQQAAMFGASREIWSNTFFSEVLPDLVEEHAPGAPYWPSTPTGGSLPFHVGEGLTHYYGVGAYKRPLHDARLAGVRFTPECLGFSNVPDADGLSKLTPSGAVPPHHPAWKVGVPRDSGAGWDFEDIRDHYLQELYDVEPVRLRSEDLDRYLDLSRVVTGEAMAAVFAEWRRGDDPCGGGLVWFLNDLRPGAGWGLVDSDGRPKAVLHHLRRAWSPRCVRLLDRGLDGLSALVVNEADEALEATLELLVLARGGALIGEAERTVRVPGRSTRETDVEAAFGHFLDSTYSYRFGPPRHEAVVARLLCDGDVVSEDVYRPVRSAMTPVTGFRAEAGTGPDGTLTVSLATDVIAYDVRIRVRDHAPDEDHFILTPDRPRSVVLRRTGDSGRSFRGHVEALNLLDTVRLSLPDASDA